MGKLSNLEKDYITITFTFSDKDINIRYKLTKRYDQEVGGEFIGEIKDNPDFQYVGDAVISHGEIYSYGGKLPFAIIKAQRGGEFTFFVHPKKLYSPELRRLRILSIRAKQEVDKSKRKKKVRGFL